MKAQSTSSSDFDGTASIAKANGSRQSGVTREVHSFFSDVEDLIKSATSLTGEELNRAKAQLMERVAGARLAAEKLGGVVTERARGTVKATDLYVREQPWKAIGIGAAAGLIVGLMLFRGGRDRSDSKE